MNVQNGISRFWNCQSKAAQGRAAAMGATITFSFQRNGIGFCFWFCPSIPIEQPAKTRIAYNVPRVYEPVVRARRRRLCSSAAAVTERRVAEGTFAVLRSKLARRLPPSEASAVTEANVPEGQATEGSAA